MQRRVYLPLVMLALLVQLFAPIGAFRAVAQAASDPLYMAAICSGMSSDDSRPAPSPQPVSHNDCCSICAVGVGGPLALDPPLLAFATLQRDYRTVAWPEAAAPAAPVRSGSNAQARAPPALPI
ncbi:MAG: DUF2946 family protein [Tardiphaga sp.]